MKINKSLIFYLFIALEVTTIVNSQCSGQPNTNPLLIANPKLLSSVQNGKKYFIQQNNTYMYVAVLQGDSYSAGYAYGQLFQQEIKQNYDQMLEFLVQYVQEMLPSDYDFFQYLPTYMQILIFEAFLEDTYLKTLPYTPQRFEDETRGIADGAGIEVGRIRRINLVPEWTHAHCTIIGAWGPATPNGGLIQMRALDWGDSGLAPLQQWPTITIYNLTEPGSQVFANIGWAGYIGTITGLSNKIGISEAENDQHNATLTSPFGTPWMYLLRDLLQFGTNLSDTINMLRTAKRTWQLYLGVGSVSDGELMGVEQAANLFDVWNAQNNTMHNYIPGVFYFDNNTCLYSTLQYAKGNITAQYMYQTVAPLKKTGDCMLAIYDFSNQLVFLSYANWTSKQPGYSLPLMQLNMSQLYTLGTEEVTIDT